MLPGGKVIVSRATKTVLVPKVPAVTNIYSTAPEMEMENGTYVILPHSIRDHLLLRHLGFNVPNPVLHHYSYRGGTPYDVQKKTVDLLTRSERAYVCNGLGTGKTACALWAWDYLYGNNLAGKLLVVAPLSTLHFVWAREAFRFLPHRRAVVLHGSKDIRRDRLAGDFDIYIINHDGVKTIAADLEARTDISVLCLDELAVYRNNSGRSQYMRRFAQRFKIVWGLTGEPMPNGPTDVWAQCKIITPTTVPKYFKTARELLMVNVGGNMPRSQIWRPKPDALEKAMAMMQPNVRFTLDDVVELPDVISRTIDIGTSTEQDIVYKKVSTELRAMVSGGIVTAVNAGAAMNKLLQIACGWVYTQAPTYVGLNPYPRINNLFELIEEAPHKVLVFVPYRHAVEELSKIFNDEKIGHSLVHGDTSPKERDKIFHEFQLDRPHINTDGKGSMKVLLAHPKCLAHGITLTAASTVIWYSPILSLETYDQANARIRRIGQKNKQQILHLQAMPVEKKVYSLLRNKQHLQEKFLELLEEATGEKNG